MGLQQFTKVAAWTVVAGLLVGAAGLAISSERGGLPLREVQGKQADRQPHKPDVEAVVALAGDPDKAPELAAEAEKAAPRPGQVKEQTARLKSLLDEKLKLMRDGVDVSLKMYQHGQGELQDVIQWQRELHQAELEDCISDRERVAVWTRALANAKEFEKVAQARKQMALASSSEVLRAAAYRLDAEIALERLKAK